MHTVTFKIQTENRVGITRDVIECFTSLDLDITGMEVKPHFIFLQIPVPESHLLASLSRFILQVQGVIRIDTISYLPYEERENRISTILATISEGVISLDEHLTIRTINRAAEQMLQIDASAFLGQPVHGLWRSAADDIVRCLRERVEILNLPIAIPHGKTGTAHFVGCYYPILPGDNADHQGVVIVLRDMKQIQELIQSVKRTGVFTFDEIIHTSWPMRQCIDTAKRVANSNATVLLTGESGTGKELFARAIHYESSRANRPFVPINCAAIPESLLESELFGYEEGAFTGALKGGKPGLFETAKGGTLFLDEIGDLPLHLQAKLLRVLEDRLVRRVGGNRLTPIDVRILAATNRNLSDMTKKGLFREDLYYRLNVIPIAIPPLRERPTDIPLLAETFMQNVCQLLNRPPLPFSKQAMHTLQVYHWPGNVRELQNVIERTVYLCPEETAEIEQVYLENFSNVASNPDAAAPNSLKQQVESFEKLLLRQALQRHKTARQTASRLGLSHTAILKKIKKYRLFSEPEE